MTHYILRRSLQSLFLLWLSTLLSFAIYQAAPGGPLLFLERSLSNERREEAKAPLQQRQRCNNLPDFTGWIVACLFNMLPGWQVKIGCQIQLPGVVGVAYSITKIVAEVCYGWTLGRSFFFKGERVADVIVERIPATALLGFSSFLVVLLIGLPLGILSALWRGTWFDTGDRNFYCACQHNARLVVRAPAFNYPWRLSRSGSTRWNGRDWR